MKKQYSLVMICLLSICSLSAMDDKEKFRKDFDKAEEQFSAIYQDGKDESMSLSKSGYTAIIPIFLDLHQQDPANMNICFKLGVCYAASRKERALAIPYFLRASATASASYKGSSHSEMNAPLIVHQLLGDAYHRNNEFDKAIASYEKYIAVMDLDKRAEVAAMKEIQRKIGMCRTGKILMANPVRLKIENLGSSVNSAYADYSPVLSADQQTLYFTSRRSETTGGQKDADGNSMEDIYSSFRTLKGWSAAKNLGSRINSEWHEASVGVSPDGQTILIYKDDDGDGNIYSTSLDGDVWTIPVKLNDNINSSSWEPSAFISADGNTLFFTSNKPGGYGGRDLYTSVLTPDGDWGKALNMGPNINTPFDEDAPFIHPDGISLSFSSNGHNTMGGFDIFTSLLSEDKIWSEPVNAGYPINTADDDIFYVVSADSRKAYLSSVRDGGFGEKDNYMVTFLDGRKTALTLIKGVVNDASGKPAKKVEIIVTDNQTGEIAGRYQTNSKTGQFLFILTPGRNYNVTYQASDHLFYSENIEIEKKSSYYELNRAVLLDPIVVGSKIVLNNIFFDFDRSTLRDLSNVELNNLVMLLKSNPNMKVEISGHTDSKGGQAYNQKLSEERAKAVVDRLGEKGISPDRMTARGYGMTMPAAANKSKAGKDDPTGRQLNRRVELKIIEIR